MDGTIASVIHFCTNDVRFLRRNVEEARQFSTLIRIVVCDHFFNGEPENRPLLEAIYREFPDCQFVEFTYDPEAIYSPAHSHIRPSDREWVALWHSTSRYLGVLHLPSSIDYVLFLDADEIIDGSKFKAWIATNEYRNYLAMRLICYIYVDRPTLRGKKWFVSALLARPDALDLTNMFHYGERWALFQQIAEPKIHALLGKDGQPFIHHYVWVRTQEEMLKKATTWGHRRDKDWKDAIARIKCDRMDLDVEFEEAACYFDPLSVSIPTYNKAPCSSPPNVLKVNSSNFFPNELAQKPKLS